MTEFGTAATAPSYVKRSRMMRERIVARELSATTLQTRPSPSVPARRSASVRCSASAAFGKDSVVMAHHQYQSPLIQYLPSASGMRTGPMVGHGSWQLCRSDRADGGFAPG